MGCKWIVISITFEDESRYPRSPHRKKRPFKVFFHILFFSHDLRTTNRLVACRCFLIPRLLKLSKRRGHSKECPLFWPALDWLFCLVLTPCVSVKGLAAAATATTTPDVTAWAAAHYEIFYFATSFRARVDSCCRPGDYLVVQKASKGILTQGRQHQPQVSMLFWFSALGHRWSLCSEMRR